MACRRSNTLRLPHRRKKTMDGCNSGETRFSAGAEGAKCAERTNLSGKRTEKDLNDTVRIQDLHGSLFPDSVT